MHGVIGHIHIVNLPLLPCCQYVLFMFGVFSPRLLSSHSGAIKLLSDIIYFIVRKENTEGNALAVTGTPHRERQKLLREQNVVAAVSVLYGACGEGGGGVMGAGEEKGVLPLLSPILLYDFIFISFEFDSHAWSVIFNRL